VPLYLHPAPPPASLRQVLYGGLPGPVASILATTAWGWHSEAGLHALRLAGPWFDGARFSLVDAVFGPVFRYFDAFDRIGDFGILGDLPKTAAWREALAARPSIKGAVAPEYPALLWEFLRARKSHLSRLIDQNALAA